MAELRAQGNFHQINRADQWLLSIARIEDKECDPDMSTRYGKQLVEDVKYRKRWAEKVGLGFELPQALETEFDVNCATCATNPNGHNCTANA